MSLPAEFQPLIRFGEFQLNLETAELRRNGDKSSLQGQPLQILTMLVENPGRMVTREELKKKLWPSDTFVDFDQSLNRAVNRLREALGDSAEKPRYIETLPRRGYRFIGSVSHQGLQTTVYDSVATKTSSLQARLQRESFKQDSETLHPNLPSYGAGTHLLRSGGRLAILVCAAVVLVGGLIAVRLFLRKNQPIGIEDLDTAKITSSGRVKNVAISPDGRYIAYAVSLGEKQALRLRQIAVGGDAEILPADLGNFVGLTFSPDANYLYFVRSDRNNLSFRYLYSMPLLGGAPTKLITDVDSGVLFRRMATILFMSTGSRHATRLKSKLRNQMAATHGSWL